MKGTGRYSSRKNHATTLEARVASFENIGKGKTVPKGYTSGGFHKPGSNKK